MATWRERGYVPDSDDEEEEDAERCAQVHVPNDNYPTPEIDPVHVSTTSIGNNADIAPLFVDVQGERHAPTAIGTVVDDGDHENTPADLTTTGDVVPEESTEPGNFATSTAAKLEAEIQKGLRTVQHVLGTLPETLDSDNDSPLSSAPPSPRSSPHRERPTDIISGGQAAFSHESDPHKVQSGSPKRAQIATVHQTSEIQVRVDNDRLDEPFDGDLQRRSFRPRAPIQLHPYALEDARYRQTWSASGLKPVRVAEGVSNAQKTSNEKSQGTTAYESSPAASQNRSLQQPSDTASGARDIAWVDANGNDESQSPVRGIRHRRLSPLSDLDDDLPNLEDLLQPQKPSHNPTRLEMSKKAKRFEPQIGKDGFQIFDLPDDHYDQESTRTASATSAQPLSPPRSRGGLSSQDGMPAAIADVETSSNTPVLLPTPLMSSDKPRSKRTFADLFDTADSDNNASSIGQESDVLSSSEEASNDESQQVHQLRRKIKGVLPASWLKLDIKGQHKPQRDTRLSLKSPTKDILEKGIAKVVPSSGRQARNVRILQARDNDLAESDTSSESDSAHPAVDAMSDVQHDEPGESYDDSIEDNAIDAMLAPRVRMHALHKRQQRLDDVFSREKSQKSRTAQAQQPVPRRAGHRKGVISSATSVHPRKKTKRKNTIPQLTILDAPGFHENDVPRFLRIASRRTGNAGPAREQDPSKKFFCLATMRDTQDVNQGVRGWTQRSRHLAPTVIPADSILSRTTTVVPQPRGLDNNNNRASTIPSLGNDTPLSDTYEADRTLRSLKHSTKATLDRIRAQQSKSYLLSSSGGGSASTASRPLAVLDYFKPRTTGRDRLASRLPQRVFAAPEDPTLPTTDRPQLLSVVKRVPRPARRKQEVQTTNTIDTAPMSISPKALNAMAEPTEPQDHLPPIPHHGRTRRTKQQQPADLRPRVYESTFLDVGLNLESLHVNDETDLIECAARYIPENNSVVNTGNHTGNQPVRYDFVSCTISSMADLAALFGVVRNTSTLTTPIFQLTLTASGWSAEVEKVISKIFADIRIIIGETRDMATFSAQRMSDVLDNAADSIQSIVNYMNQSLSFSNQQELQIFLQLMPTHIEKTLRSIADCEAATSETFVAKVLKILNGLLVLAYQLDRYATVLMSADETRKRIDGARKSLARFVWEVALREEHIGQLFAYCAAPIDSQQPRFTYVAEIETIFLIDRLGPHQGGSFYMRDISFPGGGAGEISNVRVTADSLACTVLILGCILSAERSASLPSGIDGQSPDRLGSDLRRSLVNAISDFLKSYTGLKKLGSKRSKYSPSLDWQLKQFGRTMLRWCFFFVKLHFHDIADDLVKTLFKYYSETGMVELFCPPAIEQTNRMPPFLRDQVLSEDLLPENGDTDFFIFLKLTAMVLSGGPPAGSEDQALARKLQLRKNSLLFLLLPNKGRDLVDQNPDAFEEDRDLAVIDFAGITNRYRLFAALYHYAPIGLKPGLGQISNYIDFATAHERVREVILACWTCILHCMLSQSVSMMGLQQLGQWIAEMFSTTCDKLAQIPRDNDRGNSHWDINIRAAYHVNRINRQNTVKCLHMIAERYTMAVSLCANEAQALQLLSQQEANALLLRCYVHQVNRKFEDDMTCKIFDLLAVYIDKALSKDRTSLTTFRRNLHGALTDQLVHNSYRDEIGHQTLLASMAEAWFGLGKVMVSKDFARWDQYLNDFSPMSLMQICDNENAVQCQMILLTLIAADREIVLGDPVAFVGPFLRSLLTPVSVDSKTSYAYRLLNQLMESIPDHYGLGCLLRQLSQGVTPFYLDQVDIVYHRTTIINHFIREFYGHAESREDPLVVGLRMRRFADLCRLILDTLRRTCNQVLHDSTGYAEWTALLDQVVFRISLHKGSVEKVEKLVGPYWAGQSTNNTRKLEQLFLLPADQNEPDPLNNESAVQLFRTDCQAAQLGNREKSCVSLLIKLFTASDVKYVDENGNFQLNIKAQVQFMQGVFPAYVENALAGDQPTMVFSRTVFDIAAAVMESAEARVELEDQARMEAFADLIVVLMRAAVEAMRGFDPTSLARDGWQFEMAYRLVDLVVLGGGRWAYLHQLFPCSVGITALQPLVQAYALYAFDFASSTIDRAGPDAVGRWRTDFGIVVPERSLSEDVAALRVAAAEDLRVDCEKWLLVDTTAYGPVWERRFGALPAGVKKEVVGGEAALAVVRLEEVVERLEGVLVLLGVVEEVM